MDTKCKKKFKYTSQVHISAYFLEIHIESLHKL